MRGERVEPLSDDRREALARDIRAACRSYGWSTPATDHAIETVLDTLEVRLPINSTSEV